MASKVSVLIVDDNIEFGDLLRKYVDREPDISVTGVARDGLQAIEMIKTLMPDVVVLDIIMPNLDGIGVLEKLSTEQADQKPIFIVLSAIGQDIFVKKAVSLGADYYIVKPFDVGVLTARIRQAYKEKYLNPPYKNGYFSAAVSLTDEHMNLACDLEIEVTNLMHSVGIPPHITGYHYIREIILMAVKKSKIFIPFTKVAYPEVAKKFNTTPQKVERSIRSAIECAWSRGNSGFMLTLFGGASRRCRSKPANTEFIAMMADKIRIAANGHDKTRS